MKLGMLTVGNVLIVHYYHFFAKYFQNSNRKGIHAFWATCVPCLSQLMTTGCCLSTLLCPLNQLVRLLQTWLRGYPSNLVIHLGQSAAQLRLHFESCQQALLPPIKFQCNLFDL